MVQLSWNIIIFSVFLLKLNRIDCDECTTGPITGISCPSPATIIAKYKIPTNLLRDKLTTIHQQTGERITFTRELILRNIADAKNFTTNQLTTTKMKLLLAKDEARSSPLAVQQCVNRQNLELAQISVNSLAKCGADLGLIRSKNSRSRIGKLIELLDGLSDKCAFLNPFRENLKNLDTCIGWKLKEIGLELLQIQKDFETALMDVVNLSTRCILREFSIINEKIWRVLGSVRDCKNIKMID